MVSKQVSFEKTLSKYRSVYIVVSPPRCCSTAFARVFWEHPEIGFYNHEPFETVYYSNGDLEEVAKNLSQSLDLKAINSKGSTNQEANSLMVKEMTFQSSKHFDVLTSWTVLPIVFLIRDPFLSIFSKIEKKKLSNQDPFFPLIETGWEALREQVDYCKRNSVPYLIIDATDFRNHPKKVFSRLFSELELPFYESILSWDCMEDLKIDNMDGAHNLFYQRVLKSKGIHPATETKPPIEAFPLKGGFREHVLQASEIYESLRKDKHIILP